MRVVVCLFIVVIAFSNPVWAQTGPIVPGDNLVTDGIPRIPTELAESVGRYTNFRTAVLADWHPTRREVLIGTRFGETVQLHLVKFPGGARTQLTFFPDSISSTTFQPTCSFSSCTPRSLILSATITLMKSLALSGLSLRPV